MLIRTQTGRRGAAVPLATMRSAEALANGDWRVTAADGEVFTFSKVDWEIAVETNPIATIPALPATYLIHQNDEDNEPPYFRTNVLGWFVGLDNVLRPLVIDSELTLGGWTVLHPDGRVETSSGEGWDSVTDWLTAKQRED